MKTPVRWAGSKKTLLPVLRNNWTGNSGRYIEPFCGSACLFFDLEPNKAILGDINHELITTYRALKANADLVFERLEALPKTERSYYRVRAIDPDKLNKFDAAARFLFLNRLCFNGIYRTNVNGEFNVPYARPKKRFQHDKESILGIGKLLKRASLMNDDFEVVLSKAEPGDFVYLDPPYAVAKRRVFKEYHPDTFSEGDVKRLRDAIHDLDKRGVSFLISYADSAEGRLLAEGWISRRIRTRRNVAGFISHRRNAYEILASNRALASV